MSVAWYEGCPAGSFSREVPKRVTLLGTIIALFAGLALSLCLLVSAPRQALAFTIDGDWYPDDLSGYTVTLNTHLTSPYGMSFADTWFAVEMSTDAAPASMPSGNVGYTLYCFFETAEHAAPGDPWYFYASWAQSFDASASYPNGNNYPYVSYWARYGYDGAAMVDSWWGLKSGVTRPTVSFRSTVNPSSVVTNTDFIIWIVENSDFRTRYGGSTGTSWVDPVVAQNGSSFGWSMPDTNPRSALAIQRWVSQLNNEGYWEIVSTQVPSPYSGSYTATQSGRYRFRWAYEYNNQTYTYYSNEYSVQIQQSSSLGFQNVTTSQSGNGQLFIFAQLTGSPDSVVLQYDNDGTWETYGVLSYGTVQEEQGWWWQGYVQEGKHYRLLATQNEPLSSVPYDLGVQNGGSSYDIIGYASTLTSWIASLVIVIPDFFLWMPLEIRAVLFSAIIIMIILGLVGWLKS